MKNVPLKMRKRCVATSCKIKVAGPKKNISMNKISFSGKEAPIKKKRRKRWFNFVLERRKMWVPGKTFYFKIQVQKYTHV